MACGQMSKSHRNDLPARNPMLPASPMIVLTVKAGQHSTVLKVDDPNNVGRQVEVEVPRNAKQPLELWCLVELTGGVVLGDHLAGGGMGTEGILADAGVGIADVAANKGEIIDNAAAEAGDRIVDIAAAALARLVLRLMQARLK
eukprot:5675971-Amphidinium_carterae.1